MTYTSEEQVAALRRAAFKLRQLDQLIQGVVMFVEDADILDRVADEIEEDTDDGLSPARIREIEEQVDAGSGWSVRADRYAVGSDGGLVVPLRKEQS